MKKKYLLLALTGFLLTACGEQGIGDPNKPDDPNNPGETPVDPNPDDPNEDKDPINPDIEPFEKISTLTTYLSEKALSFEQEKGVSFTRDARTGSQNMFSYDSEIFKETGTSYSNLNIIRKADITKIKDYPDGDIMSDEETKDSYDFITSVKGDYYYSVIDYKVDNYYDESVKEKYSLANANLYKQYTSLSNISSLINYFDTYVKGKYVTNGGTDKVTSTVDTTNGSFKTTFSLSYDSTDDFGKYLSEVSVNLDFSKEGYLTGYTFAYDNYSFGVDEYGNYTEDMILIMDLTDTVAITYGEKTEYDFSDLDPEDYFMTDYEVQVCSFDDIMSVTTPEDVSAFPYGEIIRVEATNVVPEKSIDKTLEIVSSSNEAVVKGTGYSEFEAVGEGKTTLTVVSTYGIQKQVEVTVVAPELTTITPRLTSQLHFVGQDEDLYIDYSPENTLDKYYITTENNDVVEVGEIEDLVTGTDVATLKFLKPGDVTLNFLREKDDKLLTQINFTVLEPLDDETLKTNILGTWYGDLESTKSGDMIKEAVKIEFNADGKGVLTLLTEDSGYTLDVNKPYEFTYTYLETHREDRLEIELSAIKFNVVDTEFTYDSNRAFYYRDGKTLRVSFTVSDPNYYGYALEFDAYKK